jgi:uncharacterized protein YkwD
MTLRTARASARAKGFRALALVMVLSCGAVAMSSCNNNVDFLTDAYLVNQARTAVGSHQLGWSPTLQAKATTWAQHLAATGVLAHSSLTAGAPAGWTELGENVGDASSILAVHSSFLNSPQHRQNMLNPKWRVMGIGVAYGRGQVWVVEQFEY